MADNIDEFPILTKTIMELAEADPDDTGEEWSEVVDENGNSRRRQLARRHDTVMTGLTRNDPPDPEAAADETVTASWVRYFVENYDFDEDDGDLPMPEDVVLQARTNVDLGSGKVVLQIIVTFDLPAGAKEGWKYAIRWTENGEDRESKVVEGAKGVITDVRAGVEYAVQVRTLGHQRKSNWTDIETIIPLKKLIIPPSPSGLDVKPGHRRVTLLWDDAREANPNFTDYHTTIIYRSETNDFTTAEIAGRKPGTRHVDDGLDNNTDYYYWITHLDTSKNESAKHPSSNTAGVHAKTSKIKDDDTDDDPPGKPTNLVLTPRTEITDSGRLRVNLIATFDPPAGGLSGKGSYILYVKESVTDDRDTRELDRDERSVTLPVRSSRTYTVKVRAKNGTGKLGDWCDTVVITIDKKANYNTGVPTGLTAYAGHRSNFLWWPELTGLDELDYAKTVIMRATTNDFTAAVEVGRTNGTTFRDANLNNRQNYWYWIYNKDTSKNASPRYPLAPATNNGVLATTTSISDDDILGLEPGTPTDVILSAGSITLDADGKVVARTKVEWTAPVIGAPVKFYRVRILEVPTGEVRVRDTADASQLSLTFNVKPQIEYSVRVIAVSKVNEPSPGTTPISFTRSKKGNTISVAGTITASPGKKRIFIEYPDVDEDANPDYSITHIFRKTNSTPPVLGVTVPKKKTKAGWILDDNLPNATDYWYWIAHKDTSGNYTSLSPAVGPVQSGGPEVSTFSDLTGTVTEPQTDQTTLSAPPSLSATQVSTDVNRDGKIDTAYRVTCGAVASGVNYEFQLYEATSQFGSYVLRDTKSSKDRVVDFQVYTSKWYKFAVAALNFNEKRGSQSMTSSGVQPNGKLTGPSVPGGSPYASGLVYGIATFWPAPTDPDYSFTRVGVLSGPGTPSGSDIKYTTSFNYNIFYYPPDGISHYVYAQHVNTSGQPSSWFLVSSSVTPQSGGYGAKTNIGSGNSGNVDPSNAINFRGAFVTVSFKCTSNTAGVTLNLNGKTRTIDFKDQTIQEWTEWFATVGPYTYSKSGGGTYVDCSLSALALNY